MEQVVAEAPAQIEDDGQTGEVAGGILDSAVGGVIAADVLLRQLDFRVHHQRIGHVPDEDQILHGVRHCDTTMWGTDRSTERKTRGGGTQKHPTCSKKNALTALDHHRADLRVVRIRFELHRAAQHQRQLGHVQQRFVVVQPQIVVRDAHLVEGDLFGVLEEAIGPPDAVQPVDVQDAILLAHVLGQTEARIAPALREEDVRDVRLGWDDPAHKFVIASSFLNAKIERINYSKQPRSENPILQLFFNYVSCSLFHLSGSSIFLAERMPISNAISKGTISVYRLCNFLIRVA